MPGVHRDGIDESRLVGLAEDLAATGYSVITVAAPDLQKFKVTPEVTDVIEDAIRWTSEQPQFRTDGKIGVLGISFTGGLSIVAAGRESIRDRVAFVMSFGGHGDLSRAMHYLASGEVLGDLENAKRSSAVLGAEHVGVHPPHDYGLAVTLLNLADRVVPPEQVAPLSRGIDGFPAGLVAGRHRSAEVGSGVRGDEEVPGDAAGTVAHLHAIRERSRGRQARVRCCCP